MKALVYDGVETLTYRDMPDPHPQPGEQLIRVAAVGICGSDMHAYLGRDPRRTAPLILGHEAAGTIEGGARHGERVTINPLVTCGTCAACKEGRENICASRQLLSLPPRHGAFAEYVVVPDDNLTTVPDDIPLTKAALVEPLAVSWHAVRLTQEMVPQNAGKPALVIGGGSIAVAAALALKAAGVASVTMVVRNTARRDYIAQACGLHAVAQSTEQHAVVIDAVGCAETRATASVLAAPGGIIAHIGFDDDNSGLDPRRMTLNEICFIGTYAYTQADFQNTAQALFAGELGTMEWLEVRNLSDGDAIFRQVEAGHILKPKVVLAPWA